MGDEPQEIHESLTDREHEILELIAEGLTNQQIADQLYLTLDTVKWYNKQTYQKLAVRSRTQAVARARELGLLGAAAPAAKHNLPPQTTPFIGREQELAEIETHLSDPGCRLLTLFGPGGIGKTRLALEAARRQVGAYPDGVYFVPFAPVESAAFVARALADGLGLAQMTQREPLEQVVNYLREKQSLVVIDNFEHLLEGVEILGEVLARSSAAKLLVTSRERLHLKEEWVYDVAGLNYPVMGQAVVDLAEYEAGELFLQTARRAQADFAADGDDEAAIVRICQMVGGMPLGIELAASWVRLLPCAEIAEEIGRDLDILTTTWRDVPERHRSIQAVLDRSWRLLTVREREVFAQLTVFSGEFGREAAEAVAGASVRMLLALVDKAFLQRGEADGFGIHELVKQYGAEKLRADERTWTATRLRHCRYHAGFLYDRMSAAAASEHLAEIEGVFDDIQAAWRYAVEGCQVGEIQQMAAGFLVYYQLHSWYRARSDAIESYHQALDCFERDSDSPGSIKAIACLCDSLGNLYALKGIYDEAMRFYRRTLDHTADSDFIGRGRIMREIGDVWVMMNDHAQAQLTYRQAEAALEQMAQRSASWWGEWTHVQTERMWLYYWANRLEDMMALDNQVRLLIEQHGPMSHRVRYLNALAMMALRRDRYFDSKDAIDYSHQALELSIESGNLGEIAWCHFAHGFCHLWSNHLDEAASHMLISQTMTDENGDLSLLARSLTYLTAVYRKRGNMERVREYATHDLSTAEEAHMPQYTGMAHAQYAWLAWLEGDLAETKRQAQAAIDDWGGLGTAQTVMPFRQFALFPLMGVALLEEDIEQVVVWARHILTPPQQRLPYDLTELMERGVTAWENGQRETANDLLHQAFQLAGQLRYI